MRAFDAKAQIDEAAEGRRVGQRAALPLDEGEQRRPGAGAEEGEFPRLGRGDPPRRGVGKTQEDDAEPLAACQQRGGIERIDETGRRDDDEILGVESAEERRRGIETAWMSPHRWFDDRDHLPRCGAGAPEEGEAQCAGRVRCDNFDEAVARTMGTRPPTRRVVG